MRKNTKNDKLPRVLEMSLAGDPSAKIKFGNLSSEQKERIVSYVNAASSHEEKKDRAKYIADSLNDDVKMWFYD